MIRIDLFIPHSATRTIRCWNWALNGSKNAAAGLKGPSAAVFPSDSSNRQTSRSQSWPKP